MRPGRSSARMRRAARQAGLRGQGEVGAHHGGSLQLGVHDVDRTRGIGLGRTGTAELQRAVSRPPDLPDEPTGGVEHLEAAALADPMPPAAVANHLPCEFNEAHPLRVAHHGELLELETG